jgi:hypothetical protein
MALLSEFERGHVTKLFAVVASVDAAVNDDVGETIPRTRAQCHGARAIIDRQKHGDSQRTRNPSQISQEYRENHQGENISFNRF